jgi:hypothetical protein
VPAYAPHRRPIHHMPKDRPLLVAGRHTLMTDYRMDLMEEFGLKPDCVGLMYSGAAGLSGHATLRWKTRLRDGYPSDEPDGIMGTRHRPNQTIHLHPRNQEEPSIGIARTGLDRARPLTT